MTIRLSHAQARALSKLDRNEPRTAAEIGETAATCNALVVAGYARPVRGIWSVAYQKVREL